MSRAPSDVLTLGPEQAGLELTHAQFSNAELQDGYRYELVAGRLHVSPTPNPPHANIQDWLLHLLHIYSAKRSDVIRRIASAARLVTRALGGVSDVQPDLALYREFPEGPFESWTEASPFLVIEVLSPGGAEKDLVRNRDLYYLVESIEEYWIIDPRDDPARPSMLALVRAEDAWIECRVEAGGVYESDRLPGLLVDLSTIYAP